MQKSLTAKAVWECALMDNCLPNQERRENTILTVAADVKAEKRPFLRSPDFPLGEISVIAGAGGIGKGQFGCYVMMCLSTGIDYRTGIKVYERQGKPCASELQKATPL